MCVSTITIPICCNPQAELVASSMSVETRTVPPLVVALAVGKIIHFEDCKWSFLILNSFHCQLKVVVHCMGLMLGHILSTYSLLTSHSCVGTRNNFIWTDGFVRE